MKKILQSLDHPIRQSVWLLIGCTIIQLLVLLFFASEKAPHFYHWIVSATILLLYAFFNSVYFLKVTDTGSYVRNSIYGFVILLVGSFGFAAAFSHLPDVDKMSVRWIFFMIIFSYFIFLTIAFFMRKIIEYAQRQDTESKT
ncbi:MAG: hypothetical protein KDC80_07265 [Saprospiraceae bacterium]|nr:hypothetical protein [Saprospiraceae bacterium]